MRIPRFFFGFSGAGQEFRLVDKEIIHQVKDVLRLKKGGVLFLFDGSGKEILAEIASIEKNSLLLKHLRTVENIQESKVGAILYCSILKKENFELVVQKATELGINEIFPIICKRTVKLDFKEDRLKKIIKEAAEQSGRVVLPTLRKTITFQECLNHAEKNELNLFFDIGREKLAGLPPRRRVGIFIGPEGGWTEEETDLAKERKFKIISLCSLSLRAETAAITAVYAAIWG